jgi:hypothetical protein
MAPCRGRPLTAASCGGTRGAGAPALAQPRGQRAARRRSGRAELRARDGLERGGAAGVRRLRGGRGRPWPRRRAVDFALRRLAAQPHVLPVASGAEPPQARRERQPAEEGGERWPARRDGAGSRGAGGAPRGLVRGARAPASPARRRPAGAPAGAVAEQLPAAGVGGGDRPPAAGGARLPGALGGRGAGGGGGARPWARPWRRGRRGVEGPRRRRCCGGRGARCRGGAALLLLLLLLRLLLRQRRAPAATATWRSGRAGRERGSRSAPTSAWRACGPGRSAAAPAPRPARWRAAQCRPGRRCRRGRRRRRRRGWCSRRWPAALRGVLRGARPRGRRWRAALRPLRQRDAGRGAGAAGAGRREARARRPASGGTRACACGTSPRGAAWRPWRRSPTRTSWRASTR